VVALEWIRASATAVSAGSPPAFSTRSPRCSFPPRDTVFATTTAFFTQSIDTEGAQRESGQHLAAIAQCLGNASLRCALHRALRGRVLTTHDVGGGQRSRWVETQDVLAVGFDQLVPQSQPDGESSAPVVRAGAAALSHRGLQRRQLSGRGRGSVEAKNLSRVLYPDDSKLQDPFSVLLSGAHQH